MAKKEVAQRLQLYLDPPAAAQLKTLCEHLEVTPTKLLYRLVDIAGTKLAAYLRGNPLAYDRRLTMTHRLEFEQSTVLSMDRAAARRRVRAFYGAQLLDKPTQETLTLLARQAHMEEHELLAHLVEHARRLATSKPNGNGASAEMGAPAERPLNGAAQSHTDAGSLPDG